MNIYQRSILLFSRGLSACASSTGGDYKYAFPKSMPGELWQGESGLRYADEDANIKTGTKQTGDVFYEIGLSNVRTAILEEDFTYHVGPIVTGKNLTLKKGSPLYARQYTFTVVKLRTFAFNERYPQSDDRNPIEWCAPAPDGKGAVCLYWQESGDVYVETSPKGSPMLPRPRNVSRGDKRPMPQFREVSHDTFPPSIKLRLTIDDISQSSIKISEEVGTIESGEFIGDKESEEKIPFDANGEAIFQYLGGKIKFSRTSKIAPNRVTVSIIKTPVIPVDSGNMKDSPPE